MLKWPTNRLPAWQEKPGEPGQASQEASHTSANLAAGKPTDLACPGPAPRLPPLRPLWLPLRQLPASAVLLACFSFRSTGKHPSSHGRGLRLLPVEVWGRRKQMPSPQQRASKQACPAQLLLSPSPPQWTRLADTAAPGFGCRAYTLCSPGCLLSSPRRIGTEACRRKKIAVSGLAPSRTLPVV
ncbi:uncharacterized protein PSFLO_04276 [Pseudozyma flocculosa]|uniref:Uncharacterized protein n=1 Tax=Pseudozyma flocculosa TaxID=84751 RepID=A0A5C3F546_9BASI|nr:uncharacterized protein PSFLO_04276 [Pseudozyma flocculosa]